MPPCSGPVRRISFPDHHKQQVLIMRKLVLLAAIAAALVSTAAAAQTVPQSSGRQDADATVIEVRGLCGLGWHRGPWGGCRPNGPAYVYGPYVAYAPPPYPPRCWWVGTAYGPRRVCGW